MRNTLSSRGVHSARNNSEIATDALPKGNLITAGFRAESYFVKCFH